MSAKFGGRKRQNDKELKSISLEKTSRRQQIYGCKISSYLDDNISRIELIIVDKICKSQSHCISFCVVATLELDMST